MFLDKENIKLKNHLEIFGGANLTRGTKPCLKFFLCLSLVLSLFSCGSSKKAKRDEVKRATTIQNVIDYSKTYLGTPYKYGGSSSAGMDCSGLIQLSFMQYGIEIPRVSRDMSKIGKSIRLKHVKVGDLVFFRTSKNSRRINHVGLVVKSTYNTIKFIHSSSSRGVMISSLTNPYWQRNYVKSRRIVF